MTLCLYRWMLCSDVLEEVNIGGNWIGDGGGRELVLALQQRKEGSYTLQRITTLIIKFVALSCSCQLDYLLSN